MHYYDYFLNSVDFKKYSIMNLMIGLCFFKKYYVSNDLHLPSSGPAVIILLKKLYRMYGLMCKNLQVQTHFKKRIRIHLIR